MFWKSSPSQLERRQIFLTTLASEVIGVLVPQMMLLGLDQPGSAPMEGSYIGGRSRGYVYGVAVCTLTEFGVPIDDDEAFSVALHAAFGAIYPAEHVESLAFSTMDEARDGVPDVTEGFGRAEAEFDDRQRGRQFANAIGFWLYNNGLADRAA